MRFTTVTLHPSLDRLLEVERLTPGALLDARLRAVVPAGKGINTARVLRRLIADPIRVVAWVGEAEAPFFRGVLSRQGLQVALQPRPCPTRECPTILERATGRETHLKEAMPAPGRQEEAVLRRFLAGLNLRRDAVALCGSAPAGTRRASLAGWLVLLRRARFLIADTSGPLLAAAGRAGVDGVKGNADEIAEWLGLEGPWDPARTRHRRALLMRLTTECACGGPRARLASEPAAGKAPRAALVTRGGAGAVLAMAGELWQARPPRLQAAFLPLPHGRGSGRVLGSAVGCGDAATAGWLWALAEGAGPEETVRRAVACGTAKLCCADPGALDVRLARGLVARTRAVRLRP